MTKRLSIRSLVDVEREGVVSFPIAPDGGARGPKACLSLRSSGDMSRPGSDARSGDSGSDRTAESGGARLALFERLGIDRSKVAALHQVHSQRIVVIEEDWHEGSEGDGLLTRDQSCVIAVTVADCVPIYLHDRKTGAVGLLHSGWRGTGIALSALARMAQMFGTSPQDVSAVIGPGIGPCCYRVNEERAALFRERWGEGAVVRRDGEPYLDLPSINERMLRSAGVGAISLVSDCTSCSDFLGSYRREGPEQYTKMLALIGHFR